MVRIFSLSRDQPRKITDWISKMALICIMQGWEPDLFLEIIQTPLFSQLEYISSHLSISNLCAAHQSFNPHTQAERDTMSENPSDHSGADAVSEKEFQEEREDLSSMLIQGGTASLEKCSYELGERLRKQEHADIYSVLGGSWPNLEARAYKIDGISDKLRKYRLKCIKRMQSRVVLEMGIGPLLVVIYRTDCADDGAPEATLKQEETVEKVEESEGIQDTKSKSNQQRESARLRQLERRQRSRAKEKHDKVQKIDGEHTVEESEESYDSDETLYVLLHLAYNDRPELRKQLPPASREVLENYLRFQPIHFQDENELETFMNDKLKEVLFLRRQNQKLPGREKRRKEEYAELLKKQMLLSKGSDEHKAMQAEVTMAQHKLRVIRHVQQLLPKVIADANTNYKGLKDRLKRAREVKKQIEDLQEWSRLDRQLEFSEAISHEVVPGSVPYMDAVARVQSSLESKQKFAHRIDQSSTETIESLKEKLEMFLMFC